MVDAGQVHRSDPDVGHFALLDLRFRLRGGFGTYGVMGRNPRNWRRCSICSGVIGGDNSPPDLPSSHN